ncbi:MAG: hypothetical protein A3C36_01105 [Omnitrophica WOR_2 bacterium RIFCSPHIGHO2_02_FULL_52_10]|nr:MAG: hypothetical protein A3C36_01105 [Omnitrophica WOR_2 bacterium RIFCSPHIGHO2_02_FULL_52_10]
MIDIFKNTESFIAVNGERIAQLKQTAQQSTKRLSRLCIHQSTNDLIQEMLLAFCQDCLITPNDASGRSMSFNIIEGEMLLVLFDDYGKVTNFVQMGPIGSGKVFMYRLCLPTWHALIPMSKFVVIYECIEGPFIKSSKPLPKWVPVDPNELRSFLSRISEDCACV